MEGNSKLSWLNEKITVGASNIEGEGMVAQSKIFKDEMLIVQGGQCLHIDEIDAAEQDEYSYWGFQVEEKIYIFPIFVNKKPILDGIFKVNHSCEPNAGFSGQITLVAMRDIEPGEEILFDYAMTDIQFDGDIEWNPAPCHCGSVNCRKNITGKDWKLPELHERYKGYFSHHVTKAIAKLNING